MASSSSSAEPRSIVSAKQYDVFISHRGPDVKHTLAKQLYDLLQARRLRAFLDREEIEGGDSIPAAIRNGICSSRVQIAIFSKGFAESSWCLDELVLMLYQTDALFIPLFYGVQPWELRHIHNDYQFNLWRSLRSLLSKEKKSQYAKAFAGYQSKGRYIDKLDGWKRALASAADISGYELDNHQEELLEKVVSGVVQVVQEKEKRVPLPVAKYPVGLDELVQHFERCCSKTKLNLKTVGIFGLGGCGKTTLATELFNRKSSGYHSSSFLSGVRELDVRRELRSLERQLLKDLFSIDEDIKSVPDGMRKVKNHLKRAMDLRFLIVLDDINHEDQLDALLPEGILASGSLVIITTRDQSVLRGVDVSYEMKEMDRRHAQDPFCSHAFRRPDPSIPVDVRYQKFVESFVYVCKGLPLSLVVLGAHVYKRELSYWNLELKKVKEIQPWDIKKRLKISFDGLDTDEQQIFIDIARLFNKKIDLHYNTRNKAIIIWKAWGWNAEHALQTLQDKCLIKMNPHLFEMHDHLRDLGREMGDEIGPPRLWQPLQLLRYVEGKGLQQILVELTEERRICFHSFQDSSLRRQITFFTAVTGLVFLEIEDGDNMLYNIPSWIPLWNLSYLSINIVENLWSSFETLLQLRAKQEKLRAELDELRAKFYPALFFEQALFAVQHLLRTEQEQVHAKLRLPELNEWECTFKLRSLRILNSPTLHGLPNIIENLSQLEELEIVHSLEKTDTTSLVQSLKQLSNLRSVSLGETKGGLFTGDLDLSKDRDCSTSRGMDSLESIKLVSLPNILKLVISEEMCPKLQRLEITSMHNLKKMELKSLFAGYRSLEEISISGCPELQSVQGVEELPGLKSLVIEVNACARNYIGGLWSLSAKKTIFLQKAIEAKAPLKSNLSFIFSDGIDAKPFTGVFMTEDEVKRREYSLKMENSSSAITLYALLVTSHPFLKIDNCWMSGNDDWLITVVLTQHNTEASLGLNSKINKGFKVTFKFGEEGKAFTVLQRIVDQLPS